MALISSTDRRDSVWPELPLSGWPISGWKDTYATLHMWTQVVGKLQLKLNPFVNHWWEAALSVSSRGLRSYPMPYGSRVFEIEFDFIDHVLWIRTGEGEVRAMALAPKSVADFYRELVALLGSLGIEVRIDLEPKEVPNPIPFPKDQVHASYEGESARRFHTLLVQVDRVFKVFRSDFIGKCSPVHFFWGSFDLAVSRFSGRKAPARLGVDHITEVAYSHEVMSCGFWPGSVNILEPAFYAYAFPEPPGFSTSPILPSTAFYNPPTKGFILRYEDVRTAADPDQTILQFCRSAYESAAGLGGWDREALERKRTPFLRAA